MKTCWLSHLDLRTYSSKCYETYQLSYKILLTLGSLFFVPQCPWYGKSLRKVAWLYLVIFRRAPGVSVFLQKSKYFSVFIEKFHKFQSPTNPNESKEGKENGLQTWRPDFEKQGVCIRFRQKLSERVLRLLFRNRLRIETAKDLLWLWLRQILSKILPNPRMEWVPQDRM